VSSCRVEVLAIRSHFPLWELSCQSWLVIPIQTPRLTLPGGTTRRCPNATPGLWCTLTKDTAIVWPGSLRMASLLPVTYCDVYATNKTGSRSYDWIYYHLVTHLLLTMLTRWQYSTISRLHNLQFTAAVFFHHKLPLSIPCRELIWRTELSEYSYWTKTVFILARTKLNSLYNLHADHTDKIPPLSLKSV
jgi:hypothetical protein